MPSVEEILAQKPIEEGWKDAVAAVVPHGLDVHGTPGHREFAILLALAEHAKLLREIASHLKALIPAKTAK